MYIFNSQTLVTNPCLEYTLYSSKKDLFALLIVNHYAGRERTGAMQKANNKNGNSI